jgi:prepilin-type N-terminal cleavage/methylation domain-containing protein
MIGVRPSSPSGRGFTLIELLVVIAIIAILASILFPVFSQARAKARRTQCQSNMRQLSLAIQMYASDNDEVLPLWSLIGGAPGANPTAQPYTWDQQIDDYTRNTDILLCPDNSYGRGLRSYALPRYVSGLEISFIVNPVKTVVLFEKGGYPPGDWKDATGENFSQTRDQTLNGPCWHSDGKVFAYIDGHIKWHRRSAGPFAEVWRTGGRPGDCQYPLVSPEGDLPPIW